VTRRSFLAMLWTLLIIAASISVFHGQEVYGLPDSSSKLQEESLVFPEPEVVALVNGSRAYDYDLQLENIAFAHPTFRSSGSLGANETANWIKEQFESFGLEAWLEPFQFTNWTLLNKPSLVIDEDGNQSTTNDQVPIGSFQCEHYSWFTPSEGVFADLVILPLPLAADYTEIGKRPIDKAAWDAINTAGKIVLIGREIRTAPPKSGWIQLFIDKLRAQRPAAVVYTWWYDWMSFVPTFHSSAGGLPLGGYGSYYWNLSIPVGFINYDDGLLIRNKENSMNISANVSIESVIVNGTSYNVVGRIKGYRNPERLVIVSSHYDTVMCSGFCDNGAGTAGVIELASVLGEAIDRELYRPSYTLLFVTFACEELYCVGSVNYIKQHKNEMANVTAVINLDCIGSDDLYVTETDRVDGFDLDQIIVNAAQDLGINITLEPPADSDHESFRDPLKFNEMVLWNWNFDANISDATSVISSLMLESFPLLYSDQWYMGTPGWIHTPYDNSTSTTTLNWVETEDLGNHIKVAALSILRVSLDISIPEFWPNILLPLFMAITLLICILARKEIHSQRFQHS